MTQTWDIAIVGAGAAGLMAAIWAGGYPGQEEGKRLRIGLLDGAARPGAKILVAGGGRCNVTHDVVGAEDFASGDYASDRHRIAGILRTWTVEETVEFFERIGVELVREETGKLFPVTNRAQTVLNALVETVEKMGVERVTDCRVTGMRWQEKEFVLSTTQGEMRAGKVILATGGKSLPKTGSDGSGYGLAMGCGHGVREVFPGLVPLLLGEGAWTKELPGLSCEVMLKVVAGSGKVLRRETGAMLLTHFGISGPVVLDISRHWMAEKKKDAEVGLVVNWTVDQEFGDVERAILERAEKRERMTVGKFLSRWFVQRLATGFCVQEVGVEPGTFLDQLSREARRRLAHGLTGMRLDVTGDRGWLFAEVTAGGVPLGEMDAATMQSRKNEKLYLCGEILDVDGRIGGYNFQWAWTTGRLAGMEAAKEARKKRGENDRGEVGG